MVFMSHIDIPAKPRRSIFILYLLNLLIEIDLQNEFYCDNFQKTLYYQNVPGPLIHL